MGKCYILGAGFSKAVSDLPVMKDLTAGFWAIRRKEHKHGHNNRVAWGDQIEDYLRYLETEFFVNPCIDVMNGESYSECNFQENLEALISFIDLNTSGEIRATRIDKTGRAFNFAKPSLFWNFTDLDELRTCLQTYIFLSLIRPEIKPDALVPFLNLIDVDDEIISFNYDLIVEKALFDMGIWKPRDGYGIEFTDFPTVVSSHDIESRLQIRKLHGSLNWNSNFSLRFFYDDNIPIFPGYLQDPPYKPRYQGKHLGVWMLPSFIKQFTDSRLIGVWQKAFAAVRRSDEIVIIGYSLPKEDSAASLLFGTSGMSEKRITIVDPNADELLGRYRSITSSCKIERHRSLEDFVHIYGT